MHDVEQDPHIKRLRWRKIEPDAGFLQKETLGPIYLLLSQMSSVNIEPNTGENTWETWDLGKDS